MKSRIRAKEIWPGMFSNEKYVVIEVDGKPYALFVDQASLRDNELEVQVVEVSGETVLVELPRETINAGSRFRIPRSLLLTV